MSRNKNLLDDSDEEQGEKSSFKINRGYADSYNKWREKEEFQKLKDRYGDAAGDSESSETESEDFDPEDLNPEAEKDFLTVLSALKGKDPAIYDNSKKFFVEAKQESVEKSTKNEGKLVEKPMFLRDYERKVILEKHGKLSDEDDEMEQKIGQDLPYTAQQTKIKESFKVKLEDDDDFLIPRHKTEEEKKKEESEFVEWLKGQKKEISEETDKKKLKSLHDYWNDPNLEEGEKFLKDYLLNRKFVDADADDDNNIPSYDEIVEDEEDEKILEAQDEFEHKYNFRYEEPDSEFVKSYPRTVKDSLRRKDKTKKQKRETLKERKEKEKEQKREEIKRLKNLKRKEIVEKLQRIKDVTGQDEFSLDPDELDKDFDPADYDKKMKQLFADDFYSKGEADNEKPTFTPSDSDETDEEALDEWQTNQPSSSSKGIIDEQDEACESKKRKSSKFLQAVKRKKPIFEPGEKSFEQYFDEYYKLDYEDIIADNTICRFKYRKVTPNDFGLSTEEILRAKPKELNAWVSVHKMSQYRNESDEIYDVNAYKKKAEDSTKKQRILTSLYKLEEDEELTKETGKKKNRKKNKNKNLEEDANEKVSESKIDHSEVKLEQKQNEKKKNVDHSNQVLDANAVVKVENESKSQRKRKKKLPRTAVNKSNIIQSLPDERLKAYGLNPKKLKNKLKYKNN